MSSHNRAYAPRLGEPLRLRHRNPRNFVATAIRLPRWVRNRRRARRAESEAPEYAILNDISHDFLALHYYITRDAQQHQLTAHGFDLLACFDLEGRPVGPGESAADCPELHYVARRSPDQTTRGATPAY